MSSNSNQLPAAEKPKRVSKHHRKHDSDPFAELLELPDSYSALDEKVKDPKDEDERNMSLYERLVIAPIEMISFLLSLSVVTRQDMAWRAAQHDNGNSGRWRWWSRWFPAEPYQEPDDSTWHTTAAATSNSNDLHGDVPTPAADSEIRYTRHKKHREMGKLQLENAFALQHTVVILITAWALATILGFIWLLKRVIDHFC